ncbi:hypothetical protein [Pseudomonas sp. 8 R 14]|uniref:hypothetical protein n=1 Tax=Pseudomonas sp. 8 R 14 TaxID=1844092 RepID=UPI0008126FF4|nr:hypothetical protein [Pseudomonas sp. 8 R 14]CRM76738.1 hypothetical protein [Pseudomonas sp. 8 R 14]
MFNLLVRAGGWGERRDEVSVGRIYITAEQEPLLKPGGVLNLTILKSIPAIFAEETNHDDPNQVARVGQISDAQFIGQSVAIEYRYDPNVPPIPQADLVALAPALGIHIPRRGFGPFEHSHWAVKGTDLFRVLMTEWRRPVRKPSVFQLDDHQHVDSDLLSAMMPFSGFNSVWEAIQRATEANGMRWDRADNRWDHSAIIQDVVALIDQAAIVVCDCSGKNANVFYEMGIAHSLGKEVIIITQNAADIPFDIAHLRHIRYLPNGEGIEQLERDLTTRIRNIRER